jgi:hypothetical protein
MVNGTSDGGPPADTYLHTSRLGRGHAWVNGHNVGRFWTRLGPQQALFVPGVWLREGENEVVVFEIELSLDAPQVWFDAKPDFSGGRLSQRGGLMLGALLHGWWTRFLDGNSHDRFFAVDSLNRQLGVM